MSKVYAGLKRIGYSDDKAPNVADIGSGTTVTWITGKVSADSGNNPEKISSDTTDGAVSGGSTVTPEWTVYNRTNFATLEGFESADTEKYWYLEYLDGRVLVSDIPFNVMVRDAQAFNKADGADAIVITAVKHGITPNIFRTLAAS